MQTFFQMIEVIALGIEAVGVAVMLIGFALAARSYLATRKGFSSHEAYIEFRHAIGRSILLGLDFLIAGDIIKTVVVADSDAFSVLVLGAVVLIRTFLSMTLHLEVEGRWPWQREERG